VNTRLRFAALGFGILCLLMALSTQTASSQVIRAEARVDSSHYLIGDWINLTVEVEHTGNVTLVWPQLTDSLKSLEVIRQSEPTVVQTGMRIFERKQWTLASYDSGLFIIPALSIPYTQTNDTTKRFVHTSPLFISVRSVPIDTTQDIKDIKPPLSVPLSLAEILPYLLALVGIGAIAWLAYVYLKKRKRGESILPPPPPRPAHEVALEALRILEAERLWQRGKVKEYHSRLTDILRTYIERRHGIMAMEMTTDETLKALTAALPQDGTPVLSTLEEILLRADLVKFARFQPLPEENERSMALARSFIESTKTVQEPETLQQRVEKVEG